MDNMLNIVAGLMVIILLAVLLLRRNKAQKPPTRSITKASKSTATSVPVARKPTESSRPDQSVIDQGATKFDPLTIAQRFIDQQRYDKAIETLERGLKDKPQDTQLSLKLLNIYAITNQHEDFNKTYDAIHSSADTVAIDEANQLKALLDQEQVQNTPVQPQADKEADFESIDFDLSTSQQATQTQPIQNIDSLDNSDDFNTLDLNVQSETVEAQHIDSDNNANDDGFSLTLDDLETSELEVSDSETSHAGSDNTEFDISADETFEKPSSTVENIDNDFTFDFDPPADTDLFVEETPKTHAQESHSEESISLENDFVLDLEDLSKEADDFDIQENENAEQNTEIDSSEDFMLFLEDEEERKNEANILSDFNAQTEEADSVLGMGVADTISQLDELSFDDEISINTNIDTNVDTAINTDTQPTTKDVTAATTDSSVQDSAPADDNMLIDDDFDFDALISSPSADTPVATEGDDTDAISFSEEADTHSQDPVTPEASADFAAQFDADFDFVKTLDNNQVTLDLATQYLQLGEYDSAKRLLNEVVMQGNSEQQSQAQALLARTA